MLEGLLIALAVILIVVVIIIISCIKVVPQTKAYVVERLGKFYKVWGTGIHFLCPFIDKIANDSSSVSYNQKFSTGKTGIVNLKEQVIDFDPQPVITKDNVTMQIDTVIYFQITDPKAYVYGVSNPIRALDTLTTTTIRNIMGALDLDEALTSREIVNAKMREILDDATDPWGIKVVRVEVKNIMPPKDIREAMEKQMRAERERREAILRAEGEKQAAILAAEGYKESQILRAEAAREASIREAEGQARAIYLINEAQAQALEMLKRVGGEQGLLILKAYEALEKMADGKATKIIVPSDMQGIAGTAMSIKEIISQQVEGEKQ
ncbi:MAG: SPFH domain-containing protein [Bacilli bacterium]